MIDDFVAFLWNTGYFPPGNCLFICVYIANNNNISFSRKINNFSGELSVFEKRNSSTF